MNRTTRLAALLAVAATAYAGTASADGKGTYDKTCATCHAAGIANAPKLGDKAAWAPRIKQGDATLVATVIKGKGAMPPKGGAANLSDADIKEAVAYMVAQSK
jgi:cytochrome c5